MPELAISKIRQSALVTVSMIALCVAGVASCILLMAGAAAVESDKQTDTDSLFGGAGFRGYEITLGIDLGFSWWVMVYTGLLYVSATLIWLLSMSKGVIVFVAFSQPLALLFAVAFAWTGVEMRHARPLTGTTSSVDAWFTGLLFTAFTTGAYTLFFSSWQSLVATQEAVAPAAGVQQKQYDVESLSAGPPRPSYASPSVVHYNAAATPHVAPDTPSPAESAYGSPSMS